MPCLEHLAMCPSYSRILGVCLPVIMILVNSTFSPNNEGGDLTPSLERDIPPFCSDKSAFLTDSGCRGVVNGVLLLETTDKNFNTHLSLWNPATREFKVIPDWPIEGVVKVGAEFMGLGFDPVSNDFKVVGHVTHVPTGDTSHKVTDDKYEMSPLHVTINQFQMYSLHTNSWKKLQGPSGFVRWDFPTTDGYLNGTHYWAADMLDSDWIHICYPVILSFNFNTEVFRVSDPPQPADEGLLDFGRWIGLYKDSLAWIVRQNDDMRDPAVCSFDVWIVTKFDDDSYGVPLSWQHLLTVGPVPLSHILRLGTFRMDGDMLVAIQEDSWPKCEANLYNPSMCTFKKLGISFGGCYRYIESLFRIS